MWQISVGNNSYLTMAEKNLIYRSNSTVLSFYSLCPTENKQCQQGTDRLSAHEPYNMVPVEKFALIQPDSGPGCCNTSNHIFGKFIEIFSDLLCVILEIDLIKAH